MFRIRKETNPDRRRNRQVDDRIRLILRLQLPDTHLKLKEDVSHQMIRTVRTKLQTSLKTTVKPILTILKHKDGRDIYEMD